MKNPIHLAAAALRQASDHLMQAASNECATGNTFEVYLLVKQTISLNTQAAQLERRYGDKR